MAFSFEKQFSCQEIVDHIQSGGRRRTDAVGSLYAQYYGFIRRIARELGAREDLVAEAYVDAVLALEKSVIEGRFEVKAKGACSSYLYQALKNGCLKLLKKEMRESPLQPNLPEPPDPDGSPWDRLDSQQLIYFVGTLSITCQQVLMDYRDGYRAEEIAERAGLKDLNSYYATKSQCLKRLKEIIRKHADAA